MFGSGRTGSGAGAWKRDERQRGQDDDRASHGGDSSGMVRSAAIARHRSTRRGSDGRDSSTKTRQARRDRVSPGSLPSGPGTLSSPTESETRSQNAAVLQVPVQVPAHGAGSSRARHQAEIEEDSNAALRPRRSTLARGRIPRGGRRLSRARDLSGPVRVWPLAGRRRR